MFRSIMIIFIFLSIAINTYSQSRFGRELDDSLIHTTLSYSGDLYVGIDNPIYISDSIFIKYDSIEITSNNGIILSGKDYTLIPLRPGTLRTVIFGYNSGNKYIIGHKNYIVHRLPPQRLILDERILETFTKVPIEKLINTKQIKVFVSDDIVDSEAWYQVSEFTIGHTYGGMVISSTNIGDTITEGTIQFLEKLKTGQIVTVNAMITNKYSVVKALPTIKLMIIGSP